MLAFVFFIIQIILIIGLIFYIFDKLQTISENKVKLTELENRITKLEEKK
jgi:hypothetical protein